MKSSVAILALIGAASASGLPARGASLFKRQDDTVFVPPSVCDGNPDPNCCDPDADPDCCEVGDITCCDPQFDPTCPFVDPVVTTTATADVTTSTVVTITTTVVSTGTVIVSGTASVYVPPYVSPNAYYGPATGGNGYYPPSYPTSTPCDTYSSDSYHTQYNGNAPYPTAEYPADYNGASYPAHYTPSPYAASPYAGSYPADAATHPADAATYPADAATYPADAATYPAGAATYPADAAATPYAAETHVPCPSCPPKVITSPCPESTMYAVAATPKYNGTATGSYPAAYTGSAGVVKPLGALIAGALVVIAML